MLLPEESSLPHTILPKSVNNISTIDFGISSHTDNTLHQQQLSN